MTDPRADLRRHDLAYLLPDAWATLRAPAGSAAWRDCLRVWRDRGLPLEVATQAPDAGRRLVLELPAPPRHGGERFACRVDWDEVSHFDAFPPLAAIEPQLAPACSARLRRFAEALPGLGARARAIGAHGWQALTGFGYVGPATPVEMLLPVADAAAADRACRVLAADDPAPSGVEAVLMFPEGGIVEWRDWQAWRAGATAALRVERIDGVRPAGPADGFAAPGPGEGRR